MKSKCALWIVAGLVSMICGCISPVSENEAVPVPLHDSNSSVRCMSECVTGDLPLRDFDRQMSLAASSGKDLEYWIDGERETPGCHWHLTHIECQGGGCLYRSSGTEHLWLLSPQRNSDLKMTKVDKTSTFQQTYIFSLRPIDKN